MDVNYTVSENRIHEIRPQDPDFVIRDGFRSSVRAGFEIDNQCPSNVRNHIVDAIDRGWLIPVAYVHDTELLWGNLQR